MWFYQGKGKYTKAKKYSNIRKTKHMISKTGINYSNDKLLFAEPNSQNSNLQKLYELIHK